MAARPGSEFFTSAPKPTTAVSAPAVGNRPGAEFFGGTPAPAAPVAAEHHGSLLGNLGGDITGAITGLATAPVTLATNLIHDPVGTVSAAPAKLEHGASQFVKQEKYQWGPWVSYYEHLAKHYELQLAGDKQGAAREWAAYQRDRDLFHQRFHAHPLGPLLDLATLATAGTARVAALSSLPEKATLSDIGQAALKGHYQGDLRTLTVRASHDADVPQVTVRTLPRNAARAGRMQATDRLLKRLPADAPVVGEFARAARAIRTAAEQTKMRGLAIPELANYTHAFVGLDKWERAAAQILPKLPLPADLDRHIAQLRLVDTPEAKQQAAILSSPRFQKAYRNPDPKVLAAVEAGRALSKSREDLLRGIGEPMDRLADAPFRHTRMTRGARVGPVIGPATKVGETVRVVGQKAQGKIAAINGNGRATVYYSRFGRSVQVPLRKLEQIGPDTLQGGGKADDILAEIQAAGRPEPYYLPDQMDVAPTTRGGSIRNGRPTGLTVPANDVNQWGGVLFRGGQLALHPDILSPAYMRALVRSHGLDLFDRVREVATPIEKGKGLPAGHVWVRDVRGQHIPFTETHTGEHVNRTKDAFPEITDEIGDLTTTKDLDALEENGVRYAVPQRFADTLRVEQRAARGVVSKFFGNATTVWRALVLNLRVPWLENNIVGNTVMAALRFAGPAGLRAFLGALGQTKGGLAVQRLLKLPETRDHLTSEDVVAITPEQSKSGTFIGSQVPTGITRNWPVTAQKAVRIAGAPFQLLPKIDRATEGFLRRVGVETELRRSVEARAVLRSMPRETRSWRAAMLKAAENPDVARAASREVNDALGNFLSLSYAEQNYVRQAIPFYAWYREITRVLLKIPMDTPGRADLLARLGQASGTAAGLPSYLQGDIAVGGLDPQGRQTLLALQQMNPYTTPLQLAKAIKVVWSPDKSGGRQAAGLFNPFLALLSTTISRAAAGDRNASGLLQAFYNDLVLQLPETRIIKNKPSTLYPGRTRLDLLEQFFGDPRRKISPTVAAQYAAEGQ